MWSIEYAFTSIRNRRLKSLGIVFLLSIGVALPVTVFSWSATAEYLAFDTYWTNNTYQMLILTDEPNANSLQEVKDAQQYLLGNELVEYADYYISTSAILAKEGVHLSYYSTDTSIDYSGIQDTRVIPISNEELERISSEFNWKGNATLNNDTVLVSQTFIDHCVQSQGIRYQIGFVVSFDILTI